MEQKKKRCLFTRNRNAIERWRKTRPLDRAFTISRLISRVLITLKERKARKALEEAFEAIRQQTMRYERDGYKSSLVIFNIALYLLIAERDLQALKIDALTHPDPWKRNLCLRVILLTLHEWNLDDVTGRKLKEAMMDVGVEETLQNKLYTSLRVIRRTQEKSRKLLGYSRNATIAHRDQDALLQYRAIASLNTKEIFELATEFYAASADFISLMPQVMKETSSLNALMRQVINREKSLELPL